MIWVYATVGAAVGGSSVALLILFLRRFYFSRKQRRLADSAAGNRADNSNVRGGMPKQSLRHQHAIDVVESKGKPKHHVSRRGAAGKPALFNWSDFPLLINDAVENGWTQFAFQGLTSSPSTRAVLLSGFCAAAKSGEDPVVEIFWEVASGAVESMQKIRLNCGSKAAVPGDSAAVVIRTELPLPGPPLGNSAFPGEAYFEITVLSAGGEDGDEVIREYDSRELERRKLVAGTDSDALINFPSGKPKVVAAEESVSLSVGLTAGGTLPLKLPGSYPASVGFNSNGSVFLDGVKLVFESEKAAWGQRKRVIGCGFDPSQKRVFFTVDSGLVRVIHCTCEEFGAPMFPTLAANADVTVLVNLGQRAFEYAPANAGRTPNPCFVGPTPNPAAGAGAANALDFEDSSELFSMGRIDAHWLERFAASRGSHNSITNSDHGSFYQHNGNYNPPKPGFEEDEAAESEPEFIDLPLGSRKQSPTTNF